MLEERLEQDIKSALLSGDSEKATTPRGLKATILNEKVKLGTRDSAMADDAVIALFAKEAKKRQESADMYVQGNDQARADKELNEKAIIEAYLPAQLSEAEVEAIVDEVIAKTDASGMQAMGQVIGQVKAKAGASADGAVIATIVKRKLNG